VGGSPPSRVLARRGGGREGRCCGSIIARRGRGRSQRERNGGATLGLGVGVEGEGRETVLLGV